MSALASLSPNAKEVAKALSELSLRGPIPSVGRGDKAVGATLMAALGVEHTVTAKPRFKGLVLTARRGTKMKDVNRVNLFAKVPDWNISACKSSSEIVARYGYERDGAQKLYCTVRAGQPNTQGLYLEIDRQAGLLRERFRGSDKSTAEVVAWRLKTLQQRLLDSHPESVWVLANSTVRDGIEHFHYRFARFTGEPYVDEFPRLVEMGTVTVDHLILSEDGRVVEKGPLFKIAPQNVSALFPSSPSFDLMTL